MEGANRGRMSKAKFNELNSVVLSCTHKIHSECLKEFYLCMLNKNKLNKIKCPHCNPDLVLDYSSL
jgi:hypothetical protein